MKLESPELQNDEAIPVRHTADGEDLSPALRITDVPEGAMSLVLIMDDPDAPFGQFTHWVLFNIPPDTTEIPAGIPGAKILRNLGSASHGHNDFGHTGYGGPSPPAGKLHHYHFRLLALDRTLSLQSDAKRLAVEAASKGHVIGEAELVGTYERVAR